MLENLKSTIDLNVVYLPDYQFAKWCEDTFSINRGVYNAIDKKFYNQGIKHIEQRRKVIISFLNKTVKCTATTKFYKFGPGNLSEAINNFVVESLR